MCRTRGRWVKLKIHDCFKKFDAGNGIFHANEVNTMSADALAPVVTRSSAAMLLTAQVMPHMSSLRRDFKPSTILTHWGRVTQICISDLTIIGSDNGLSPDRRQAITWTNAGILLIGPLGTNFSEILIKIHTFSFKKIHLKTSSAKQRPFCLGLNVLMSRNHIMQIHFTLLQHHSAS